jgi:hypothetical protein
MPGRKKASPFGDLDPSWSKDKLLRALKTCLGELVGLDPDEVKKNTIHDLAAKVSRLCVCVCVCAPSIL